MAAPVNIDKPKPARLIMSAGAVLIITLAAFFPSLGNNFVNWDDNVYVTANTAIQDLSPLNLRNIFTSFFYGNYHPLTLISYLLEYIFFGLNPFIYHLTNLILHSLNSLLVFWLVHIITRRAMTSFITAILFVIHPLRVESVAWASGRKDVLYALFFLAAIVSYCYYLRGNGLKKYYYLSLILFIFSLLSKPMAITLPLVLLLIDYLFARKVSKGILLDKAPFFVLSFVFGVVAVWGQYSLGALRPEDPFNILHRLMFASYGLVFYLNKALLPLRLSCLYPYPAAGGGFPDPVYLYCLFTAGILIMGAVLSGRYTKKIIFGSGFFLVTLLPALQFVPVSATIVADRYSYVPLLGIFYVIAEGFVWLYIKKIKYARVIRISLLAILIAAVTHLTFLTYKRCLVWRNSISLWSDCLRHYPNVKMAYKNRGEAYALQGNFEQAISDFNKAIRLAPKESLLYVNLGNAYASRKDFGQAFSSYDRALQIDPKNTSAYYNRAVAYFLKREYANAWREVREAENLGCKINKGFLGALQRASRRESR